ncbi:hypothetical protein F2P81_008348 [Scophthalmus maximus]|uniref:Uncharacterized protein n=1 Tax=Scophthalmus maximus TaxID=52904 RepID=A0A6A4T223_SCOMX|nr:hypothetical protein F2P81_008348 [Scophthalmus maximus]
MRLSSVDSTTVVVRSQVSRKNSIGRLEVARTPTRSHCAGLRTDPTSYEPELNLEQLFILHVREKTAAQFISRCPSVKTNDYSCLTLQCCFTSLTGFCLVSVERCRFLVEAFMEAKNINI